MMRQLTRLLGMQSLGLGVLVACGRLGNTDPDSSSLDAGSSGGQHSGTGASDTGSGGLPTGGSGSSSGGEEGPGAGPSAGGLAEAGGGGGLGNALGGTGGDGGLGSAGTCGCSLETPPGDRLENCNPGATNWVIWACMTDSAPVDVFNDAYCLDLSIDPFRRCCPPDLTLEDVCF